MASFILSPPKSRATVRFRKPGPEAPGSSGVAPSRSDIPALPENRAADTGRLTAPMPGKVISFAVKAGDKVSKGQALAVMEAMKMEHTIAAPGDGVVAELMYGPGDQVAEGAELLKLMI